MNDVMALASISGAVSMAMCPCGESGDPAGLEQ
jgi:hypothetical protein